MKNRPPKTGEINACSPYLQAQMDAIKPEVILCLGGPAAKTLIDKNFKITKDRGQWHELHNAKVMATFHPAYVLRQHGEDLQNAKRLVWKDIQNVYAEYQKALEARSLRMFIPRVSSVGNVRDRRKKLHTEFGCRA